MSATPAEVLLVGFWALAATVLGAALTFIDATVVRMLLVPAVMQLLGRATWWSPAWLDRRLPHLHVEGRPEHHVELPEPHLPAQRPEPALA